MRKGCACRSACAPPHPHPPPLLPHPLPNTPSSFFPPTPPPGMGGGGGCQPGLGVRRDTQAQPGEEGGGVSRLGVGGGVELVRKRVHLSSAYIPSEASETRTPGRVAPSRVLPSLPIFSQPRQKIACQLEAAEQYLEFNRSSQPIDYWSCRVLTLPFFFFFSLCYF